MDSNPFNFENLLSIHANMKLFVYFPETLSQNGPFAIRIPGPYSTKILIL